MIYVLSRYLTLGSWSNYGNGSHQGGRGGGVWLVPLNSSTGMLSNAARNECGDRYPFCWDEAVWSGFPSTFVNIANRRGYDSPDGYVDGNAIEASYIFNDAKRSGYYFLFVNWYWCCRQADSTVRVPVRPWDLLFSFLFLSGYVLIASLFSLFFLLSSFSTRLPLFHAPFPSFPFCNL